MEKLGINLSLLITQIINFTIMVVVLTKLLYQPILKVLRERKMKIEEGLKFSEKAKSEEEKQGEKRKQILLEASNEAKTILEDTKKIGKKLKDEMVNEGKKELSALKEKLEKDYQQKEKELTRQISLHTVEIASQMIKSLLQNILKDNQQHKLIQNQLQKLEKTYRSE